MNDLKVGEHDLLQYLKPDTLMGAIAYLVIFILAALLLSRTLRAAVHAAMTRSVRWRPARAPGTPRPSGEPMGDVIY
jgi:hypothetical protein